MGRVENQKTFMNNIFNFHINHICADITLWTEIVMSATFLIYSSENQKKKIFFVGFVFHIPWLSEEKKLKLNWNAEP